MILIIHMPRAFIFGSAFMFIFIAMVIALHLPGLNSFDMVIINGIQPFKTTMLTNVMIFFSWIGSTPVVLWLVIITLVLLFFVLKHRMELWILLMTTAGAGIINVILKLIFQKERPLIDRLVEVHGYSFPSGHTMGAVAFYCILVFLLWRHLKKMKYKVLVIILGAFMIFMIALSRVYLGVHYPSDIIGGVAASASWTFFTIALFQKYIIE